MTDKNADDTPQPGEATPPTTASAPAATPVFSAVRTAAPGGPGGPAGPGGPGRPAAGGRGPGMMGMGMGLPPAKAKDFGGSLRRLFGRLRPERALIAAVIVLAVISVTFAVVGPKI